MFRLRNTFVFVILNFLVPFGYGKTIVPRAITQDGISPGVSYVIGEREKNLGQDTGVHGNRRVPAFGQPGLSGPIPVDEYDDNFGLKPGPAEYEFEQPSVEENRKDHDFGGKPNTLLPGEEFDNEAGNAVDSEETNFPEDEKNVTEEEEDKDDEHEREDEEDVHEDDDSESNESDEENDEDPDVKQDEENENDKKDEEPAHPEEEGENDNEGTDEEVGTGVDGEPIEEEEKKPSSHNGYAFNTPFFNVRQVSKYFQQLERAIEHLFRQKIEEAALLRGSVANTSEEDVDIDGKKYHILKSIVKSGDNSSTLYVETLSPKLNETEDSKEKL